MRLLPLALATLLIGLGACGERDASDGARAGSSGDGSSKGSARSEEGGTGRPTDEPLDPELSSEERASIANARADADGAVPGTALERPVEELTSNEREAALDDPAARNLDEPSAGRRRQQRGQRDESGSSSGSSSGRGYEPTGGDRAGVELTEGTDTVRLVDLAVASSVEDRIPKGVSDHFEEIPETFTCFVAVHNEREEATITHVWRHEGEVASRVELDVGKSPRWRTWSRHRMEAGETGDWACEVRAPDGERLGTARFTVGD